MTTPSPLLTLPGELRNHIYTLTLTSPTPIIISPSHPFTPPPLLLTSHQLRSETLQLFYKSNTFSIQIHNFSHAPLLAFCRHQARVFKRLPNDIGDLKVSLRMVGHSRSWGNLIKWLEDFYEGKVRGMKWQLGMGCEHEVLAARAFEVVKVAGALRWGVVRELVLVLKRVSEDLGVVWW